MSEEEYIKELESLVCFLSGCYEASYHEFTGKHIEICGNDNSPPNAKALDEIMRFPSIQGSRQRLEIKSLAKLKIDPSFSITEVANTIRSNHLIKT
jgi:hypothetical protein